MSILNRVVAVFEDAGAVIQRRYESGLDCTLGVGTPMWAVSVPCAIEIHEKAGSGEVCLVATCELEGLRKWKRALAYIAGLAFITLVVFRIIPAESAAAWSLINVVWPVLELGFFYDRKIVGKQLERMLACTGQRLRS